MASTDQYNNYSQSENYTYDDFGICWNEKVTKFIPVFVPTLYSIVFIVGFIGNSLVVCVLTKFHQRSNLTDMGLLNLALSDLLFLISLPFWAHDAAVVEWTFGNFMCKAVTLFYMLGFYGSIFFMVLMTVDRYTAIIHTQKSLFSKHRSASVGNIMALFIWMLSLGASLPTIVFTTVRNELDGLTCKEVYPEDTIWREVSYIQINILSWVLPLSVMTFCYSRIIPILKAMKSQKKHKAVKLILFLFSVFILFWTPYNVVIFMYFLHHLGYMQNCKWIEDLQMALQWVRTIAFTHCCLNPIIYAFVGEKFRTLVLKMLSQWLSRGFSLFTPLVRELSERRSLVLSPSSEVSSIGVV